MALQYSTTYYARVRHKGAVAGASAWSPVVTFTTQGPTWPDAELQIYPNDPPTVTNNLGAAVAISADGLVGVIGVPTTGSSNHRALIYTRSGSIWAVRSNISNGLYASSYFGESIDLSNDGATVIIGARQDKSINGTTVTGAAYIYLRSGDTWGYQAVLRASDYASGDNFGRSVSMSADGNTVAIGADLKNSNDGAVYIFHRTGTTWSQDAKIVTPNLYTGQQFGRTIKLSKDSLTLAVGETVTRSGVTWCGAVYLFTRPNTSSTVWSYHSVLFASDWATSQQGLFGEAIDFSNDGTMLLITAKGYSGTGAIPGAYIFTKSANVWSQQTKITPSDGTTGDWFGDSAALSSDGTTAIVGASRSGASPSQAGAAYVFTRSGVTWTQRQKFTISTPGANNYFGAAVALSGDGIHALIGEPGYNAGSNLGRWSYFA